MADVLTSPPQLAYSILTQCCCRLTNGITQRQSSAKPWQWEREGRGRADAQRHQSERDFVGAEENVKS